MSEHTYGEEITLMIASIMADALSFQFLITLGFLKSYYNTAHL